MNTCLAIMAHAGARDTLHDFHPQWIKLGLPIIGFVPQDEDWTGPAIDRVVRQGVGGHDGEVTYRRFLGMCQWLYQSDFDRYFIFEYDTVNLTDRAPESSPCFITGAFMACMGSHLPYGRVVASYSPWIIHRPVMARFVEAMEKKLDNPRWLEWEEGLLDRWLGMVIVDYSLRFQDITAALAYPFAHLKPLEAIRSGDRNIVHGYKRAADFKDTWPS